MFKISVACDFPGVFERTSGIGPTRESPGIEDGFLIVERDQNPMLAGPRCAAPFPFSVVGSDEAQGFGIKKRMIIFAEIKENSLLGSYPLRPLELVLEGVRPCGTDLHFFIPRS